MDMDKTFVKTSKALTSSQCCISLQIVLEYGTKSPGTWFVFHKDQREKMLNETLH